MHCQSNLFDLSHSSSYFLLKCEKNIFTGQLQEIRKVTLSKILCETLGLEKIQKDALSLTSAE